MPQSHPQLAADEIAANILSIEAVPRSVLPDGPARDALLDMAASGADCYAYHAGPADGGTWNAWLGPVADMRADHDGRIPVLAWCATYTALAAVRAAEKADRVLQLLREMRSLLNAPTGGAA